MKGKLNRVSIENKMSTKRKSFFHMDKWTKRGAIIGGIWGLITGILYTFGILAAGFTGHGDIGTLFKNVPVIWRIIYLPAYLTDIIFNLLGDLLKNIMFTPIFPIFMISWVVMPILFGVGIGVLVTAIVKKGAIK
jgi:hypothetical protein